MTLYDLAKMSTTNKQAQYIDLDNIKVEILGGYWYAYHCCLFNCEFTLYCDQGYATFFVDTYGDRITFELFDWGSDED